LLHAAGSFAIIARLLEEGQVVSVFFALPGSRETQFLGKPVMMTSGSARLARGADALILPIRTRRDGHRVHVDASAPLDPREQPDVDRLHEALAAVHERWILEFPAALEDPNRSGAWEGTATALSWRRPEPKPERRIGAGPPVVSQAAA
jgi:lauroyl/myristoyl acyltransferase